MVIVHYSELRGHEFVFRLGQNFESTKRTKKRLGNSKLNYSLKILSNGSYFYFLVLWIESSSSNHMRVWKDLQVFIKNFPWYNEISHTRLAQRWTNFECLIIACKVKKIWYLLNATAYRLVQSCCSSSTTYLPTYLPTYLGRRAPFMKHKLYLRPVWHELRVKSNLTKWPSVGQNVVLLCSTDHCPCTNDRQQQIQQQQQQIGHNFRVWDKNWNKYIIAFMLKHFLPPLLLLLSFVRSCLFKTMSFNRKRQNLRSS